MSETRAWSHQTEPDANGLVRVKIVDEDVVAVPVARQLTPGQADRLVEAIAGEVEASGRPARLVIRDAAFMAATVLMVKRQPI